VIQYCFSSINLWRLGHWQLSSFEGWMVGATTFVIWDSSDGSSSSLYSLFLQFIQLSGCKIQWNYQKHTDIHMLIGFVLIFLSEHTFCCRKIYVYYEIQSCPVCLAFSYIIRSFHIFWKSSFAVSGDFFGSSRIVLFDLIGKKVTHINNSRRGRL